MTPPAEPAPINRYARLFPPTNPPLDLDALRQLGLSMERDVTRMPPAHEGNPLPAGYTYFGQFIDHDLTLDETTFADVMAYGPTPAQTINGADGRLNLDHLYGAGPGSARHGHLYAEDGASFRLGEVRTAAGEVFDFPLGPDGVLSAEDRNVENLILRQLCVMFLKLHNLAVQELPATLDPGVRFEQARNRVCWQYQWLVREDYLYAILANAVYLAVVAGGQRQIDWRRQGFAIPVEFSQGAFRFGHSMVRARYAVNLANPDVELLTLFTPAAAEKAIDPALAVNWNRFLDRSENTLGGRGRVPAMAIDTTMVPPLFALPGDTVHHASDPGAPALPPQLAVRTLQRSARTRVATGEEVTRAFGGTVLRDRGLAGGEFSWQKLDELGLTGRTPLWYYVLLEAELEMRGLRLGTIGSQLVAEVVDGSLQTDPASYLSCFGPNWSPPPWKLPDGGSRPIRRLLDVALVTGLAQPEGAG